MILADTGFWLALSNKRDAWHPVARKAVERWGAEGFVTTWPVVTEAAYLIGERVNHAQRLRFVQDLAEGASEIWQIEQPHLQRLHTLMLRYQDLPMDLADASLVLLAEERDDGRILSTDDRDFRTYKWKNRKPFKNLLVIG